MLKAESKDYILRLLKEEKREIERDCNAWQNICLTSINQLYGNANSGFGRTDDDGFDCTAKTILNSFAENGEVTGKAAGYAQFARQEFATYQRKRGKLSDINAVIDDLERLVTEEPEEPEIKDNGPEELPFP